MILQKNKLIELLIACVYSTPVFMELKSYQRKKVDR